MYLSFRWFGKQDPVPLEYIRQIPGVHAVVGSLFEIPPGEVWPLASLQALKQTIEAAGLKLSVIESIPVHEDIKLGRGDRDKWIANYCQSIKNMGELNIPVLCYNFMPVFDWIRTDLEYHLPDGATVLQYDETKLAEIDLGKGTPDMPAWVKYSAEELNELFAAYQALSIEQLWENLEYFIKKVVPVAESASVRMAIHPDDPPWSVLGLPRIITGRKELQRVVEMVDSPSNGITLCSGSLGADRPNDPVTAADVFGHQDRINFVHLRNVRYDGYKKVHETPHPSEFGDLDLYAIMERLHAHDYTGPVRPDHGRMIWGEQRTAGYGLYDRALGVMYLQGLWEAISRQKD